MLITSSGSARVEKAVNAQVPEDATMGAATLEHLVVARSVHKLGDLWGKKSLELGDALLPLLRQRQFDRHGIEAVGQPLKLIACPYLDTVIELSRTDPLGSLLEVPDRPGDAARHTERDEARDDGAGREETSRPPKRGINWPKASDSGCSTMTVQFGPRTGAAAAATACPLVSLPVVTRPSARSTAARMA